MYCSLTFVHNVDNPDILIINKYGTQGYKKSYDPSRLLDGIDSVVAQAFYPSANVCTTNIYIDLGKKWCFEKI